MGLLDLFSIGAMDLPVGAQADVKELEYISCLLQTALPSIRADGTVSATDLRLYLRSKYGLDVTPEVAADVVRGLGGDDGRRKRGRCPPSKQEAQQQACDVGSRSDNMCSEKASDSLAEQGEEVQLQPPDVEDNLNVVDDRGSTMTKDQAQDEELGLFVSTTSEPSEERSIEDRKDLGDSEARQSSVYFDAADIIDEGTADDDENSHRENSQAVALDVSETDNEEHLLDNGNDEVSASLTQEHADDTVVAIAEDNNVEPYPRFDEKKESSANIGADQPQKEVYLDLVQLLAALLIPTLIKAKREAEIFNGIIDDDPPIPDDPELSLRLLFRQPGFFLSNYSEARRLRREREEKSRKDSLRPTPRRIIHDVLHMLVATYDEANPSGMLRRTPQSKDVKRKIPAKSSTPRRLRRVVISHDLVRDILGSIGDVDAAEDDELVDAMVMAAGGEGAVLDEMTFTKALTSDILDWSCGMEDRHGETFVDVFGFLPLAKNEFNLHGTLLSAGADAVMNTADFAIAAGITAVDAAVDTVDKLKVNEGEKDDGESIREDQNLDTASAASAKERPPVKFIHTAHYIDYINDSFRSLPFQMALYVFFLFSAGIVMSLIGTLNTHSFIKCDPGFWCNLGEQVWQWFMLAVILSSSGLIIMTPISMANDPFNESWKRNLLCVGWLLIVTLSLFFSLFVFNSGIPHDPSGKLSEVEKLIQGFYFQTALRIYLVFGLVLCLYMLSFLMQLCAPSDLRKKSLIVRALMDTYNDRRASNIKEAATRKVNALLLNASKLHFSEWSGTKVTAGEKFLLEPKRTIRVGGLFWTWYNVLTRRLSRHYGIWLHSRLSIAQECQVIVLLFGIALLVWGAETLAEDADKKRESLYEEEDGPLKDEALRFVPEGWMVKATFSFGGVFAICVAILIILVYMPSTVATIFALRSGVISTFDDPAQFNLYRKSADKVFYNVGNIIYAQIGSASLFFIIFGGIFFLFIWPVTKNSMALILSWCLGLGITIGVKTIIMMLARSHYHTALMRRRPKAANYNSLAMECWHLGLAGGTLISRLGQFLFAAAFWIGRIDVTFLDESVNLLGYSFDYTPINYRTEILVHETHKHPFINRLGGIILMRIKQGDSFGSAAGAKWRLIFTTVLFPWLARYRRLRKHEEDEDNGDGETMMLLSSIANPTGGRMARLRNRIAAREGLRLRTNYLKGSAHKSVEDEADYLEPKQGIPVSPRTGVDVMMG